MSSIDAKNGDAGATATGWWYGVTQWTTTDELQLLQEHMQRQGEAGWELVSASTSCYQTGPNSSFTLHTVHTMYWRRPNLVDEDGGHHG